jgi:hypothetical protein
MIVCAFCRDRVDDWGAMLTQDLSMGGMQGSVGGMPVSDTRAGGAHGMPPMHSGQLRQNQQQ